MATRIMNRTKLAEFFGVAMPTIDSWVRAGCPYVQRGNRGHEWRFDALEVTDWRHSYQPEQDPDMMTPSQRNAWYQGSVSKNRLETLDATLVKASEARSATAAAVQVIEEEVQKMVEAIPVEVRHIVLAMLDHGMQGMRDRLASYMSK